VRAPPPLNHPQNPVNYGADPTGNKNSAAAFQKAINAGDLDVPAGLFRINSTVYVPSNRNIRCEAGAAVKYTTRAHFIMFAWWGTTGGSAFNCRFRGPNYNRAVPSYTPVGQVILFIQSIGGHGGSLTIAHNDFNGMGGWTGAVLIYGSRANQPGPRNNLITYNTFEHCSSDAIQITSGEHNVVSHNTFQDCSGMIEADNTGQQNTGNFIDSNHSTFTNGTGAANQFGQNGWSNLFTCGASCSSLACNYSANTCSNNIVDGPKPSGLLESAVGGALNNAKYVNNTCTHGCSVY